MRLSKSGVPQPIAPLRKLGSLPAPNSVEDAWARIEAAEMPAEARARMLADLVGEGKRESASAAPKAPVPKQSGSVDRGVIDDLLGGGGDRA